MDKATERSEYITRMRRSRQFSFFGITPQWRPRDKDIEGFVHDEVVRQFHDTRVWEDGGVRVEGMLNAWHYAQGRERNTPTVEDILKLGALVEPKYNATKGHPDGEFRHKNVYIGNRMGVYPPFLGRMVELLVARAPHVVPGTSRGSLVNQLQIESFAGQVEDLIHTVDDWYLAYEWIHPFRDGNGRTGKILHNWLNETLDDPVLVPDYFGGGNP